MSGTNTDTISYFTIFMRHCTVSQPNEDEDKLVIAGAVLWFQVDPLGLLPGFLLGCNLPYLLGRLTLLEISLAMMIPLSYSFF